MVHTERRPLGKSVLIMLAMMIVGCGHTAATDKNKHLSDISMQLGADFLRKKKPLQAKAELKKAIKLDPENRAAYKLLGFVKFMEGLGSLNYIDRTQCLDGEEVDEQRKIANKHLRISEKHLHTTVKMAEKENKIESEGLLWLANIAVHFKRYDDAIKLSGKGLEHSFFPKRHLLHSVKGWAHFHRKEYRQAGEDLRQAIFHEPKFCLGRYRLAKVNFAKKKYDKVIKDLELTIKEKCPIQEAPYLLGRVYAQKRSMDKAREQFKACVQMNPKSCLSKVCERLAKDAARSTVKVAD